MRTAHHWNAAELTVTVCGGAGAAGGVNEVIDLDVARDEEIEVAVTVVVAPGCAGRPSAEAYAGLLPNVGEGSVVVVVIEAVLAEIGDEDVGPAIVVEVTNNRTEAPAVIGYAGLGCDVREGAVVVVMKERGVGRLRLSLFGVVAGAVYQIDVEPAVVVIVQQCYP